MQTIWEAASDGACRSNPGSGGWGAVVDTPDGTRHERSGSVPHTTNQRMELRGAIEALEMTPEGAKVVLVTDSQYVQNGLEKWIGSWRSRGWRTTNRQPVKNRDLWERLDTAARRRTVQVRWVRGHSGHPANTRADQLASRAAKARTKHP